MILSNVEIIKCLGRKDFLIEPLEQSVDPGKPPFNTSSVDLRLNDEIIVPRHDYPVTLDLQSGKSIAKLLHEHSEKHTITKERPFILEKNKFILANTVEKVSFPISNNKRKNCYSARVEGKSSVARCGVIVHFTAPTIHSNFFGPITLEISILSDYKFTLIPGMYICQLIIEEVKGCPKIAPNQFSGQISPSGIK